MFRLVFNCGSLFFVTQFLSFTHLIHGPVKGLQIVYGRMEHLAPVHDPTIQIVVPFGREMEFNEIPFDRLAI